MIFKIWSTYNQIDQIIKIKDYSLIGLPDNRGYQIDNFVSMWMSEYLWMAKLLAVKFFYQGKSTEFWCSYGGNETFRNMWKWISCK